MSTMASQWAQLVAQMGAEGSNAIAQGFNAGNASANTNIKQQQQDQEKQQQYRQAQQWDMDTLQHLTQEGALFGDPHTGLVKETQYQPDTTGLNNGMPIATNIMRQMDPDRTVKFKDADGNQIQAELPTADQQRARAMQTLYQQRQAESAGTAAGAPQYPTTPEYNTANNLPPGATSVPVSGAVNLAERTVPVQMRGTTQMNIADANNAAKAQRLQSALASRSQLQLQNQYENDQLATQRAQVAAGYAPAIGAARQRQFDLQQQQWQGLTGQAHQQATLADMARTAADAANTPDGQQFTHPILGTTQTMSPAWRQQLQTAAEQAEEQGQQLYRRASTIAQQMGIQLPAQGAPSQNVPPSPTGAAAPLQQVGPRSVPPSPAGPGPGAAALPTQPAGPPMQRGRRASGGAAAPDSAVDATARMIANYQLHPLSPYALGRPEGQALMARVATINPAYDSTQYNNRNKTRMAFTTGTQGQQANSMNTAIGHLDQMSDAMKGLDNSDIQVVNQAKQWLGTQFGGAAATNFNTLKVAVSGELASVLKKSGATDSEIKSVESTINSKNSPAQLSGYIDTQIPILGSKLSALNYQYHQAMGEKDPFQALSPEAKGVLVKRGFDPDNPRVAGGGGGGANYKQFAVGPNGHRIGSNDGQKTWYDVQSGQQVK